MSEQELPGGMGGVARQGRTVSRPAGPWTSAVDDVLRHLAACGLRGVPRALGVAEGRARYGWVEGRGVAADETVLDSVLVEAVAWLRDFHDAVEGYRPVGAVRWRRGPAELAADQIICHNDPGTYNWLIEGGHFAAMIDWEMAGPGRRVDDLAFLVWTALPLHGPAPADAVARRLDLVVETYPEIGPIGLLDAVTTRMTTAVERIEAGIAAGDEGFLALAQAGEPGRTRARIDAFGGRVEAIIAALG